MVKQYFCRSNTYPPPTSTFFRILTYGRLLLEHILMKSLLTALMGLVCLPIILFGQSSTCVVGSVNNSAQDSWSPDCYLDNNCMLQGSPCSANDVNVAGTFLADANGDPISVCTPGTQFQAYLWAVFVNNTNAPRYAVRTYAEPVFDGVYTMGTEFNICAGDIIPVNGSTETRLLGPITIDCGVSIELRNLWIAWNTTASQCSDPQARNYSVKCNQYSNSKCFVELSEARGPGRRADGG